MRRSRAVLAVAAVVALLVGGVWIFSNGLGRAPPAGTEPVLPASAEGVTVGPSGLAIPVVGVRAEELTKSFDTAPAGATPVHDAIDILAPAGTAVVAAASGTVEELSYNAGGDGIAAYIRSEDGHLVYYYAHLQGYAPGLEEGHRVSRGQLIGRVGSTGNASPRGPHLHFAIKRVQPGGRWWQGTAVNPLPALIGRPND